MNGLNIMAEIGQQREVLFSYREKPDFAECRFYHAIELPGHGEILGAWDLRGREAAYLGSVALSGKRVLEIGPASGGLTAYIVRQDADVVCFETSEELAPDVLPNVRKDIELQKKGAQEFLRQLTNAWWYTKHTLNLSAKIIYGDVNSIPSSVGSVDISFLGMILLHCRSPFGVVQQACMAAQEAVIVTDLMTAGFEDLNDSLIRFNPSRGEHPHSW